MGKFISYGRQCIEEDDIEAVVGVLRSDYLTQGPKIEEFEDSLASYCGSRFAVCFSSGTAALHGAYFAAGLCDNDEIIMSPVTFVATANAALFLGARPVFIDIEPDTGNIDVDLIERAITPKTQAIAPVHFAGHPVNLDDLSQLAGKHNLILIEDACHALGAQYCDNKIGNCKYSDMTVFSFHPLKAITTGEGGAVLTNDEDFYKKLIMFRHHGITKEDDALQKRNEGCGKWYYEMQHLGYNYRLSDIHCALGISQLKKLDGFIERRMEIAGKYSSAFKDNEFFDICAKRSYAKPAWHLYPIKLKDKFKPFKAEIFSGLRQRGLGVQVHYIPVHIQPYYQQLGYKSTCPNAEDFYERQISLPLYPAMSSEDVDFVIENVLEVFTCRITA
ncbi:MAG: UDP-4-amino-4,6-dideoxy-N-acetyl-beta-L-altrosamine transaminase [Planctomycetota bacterium]